MSPAGYLDEVPVGSYVRLSDLPGSFEAARSAVSRAARKGLLAHVSRGLYFKGVATMYGMPTPSPEEVALEVVGHRGAGPAGVSAARALGLTTQVPAMPHLAVVGRVPGSVRGVRLTKRNNLERVGLTYTEIALLETLRSWTTTVDAGWDGLVEAVRARVASGGIRLDVVRRAAAREHSRAVAEGMRRLVEGLAEPADAA